MTNKVVKSRGLSNDIVMSGPLSTLENRQTIVKKPQALGFSSELKNLKNS